mgnify:CR=1 FL=1
MNGVGIAPRDLGRYPRYTGGLLVQDANGDGRLDPARDKVVGGIIGTTLGLISGYFGGRTDVFPVRWENSRTGKSGYAPACVNEWV